MKKIISILFFSCMVCVVPAQTVQLKTDSLVLALDEVSSVEGCRQHTNTVKAAAAYYLYTPYSEKDIVRQPCAQLVTQWAINTDELSLSISPHMHEGLIVKDVKKGELLVAYLAAACFYAINNGEKETTLDAYIYAMEETLHYYQRNRSIIGKSKYWEKLLKKTDEQRRAELTELYKKDYK